jgi:hypothetical protein
VAQYLPVVSDLSVGCDFAVVSLGARDPGAGTRRRTVDHSWHTEDEAAIGGQRRITIHRHANATRITATVVPDRARPHFWAKHFGDRRQRAEMMVFRGIKRLCRSYVGAYWHYYELSNGGMYAAPHLGGPMRIEAPLNGYEGDLTADAAGITATVYALRGLAAFIRAADDCDALLERYYLLYAYIRQHPQSQQILAAID